MEGDNRVRFPKISGQYRKALKFITTVFLKYSKNTDLCKVLLNTKKKKKLKSKEDKNSIEDKWMPSTSSSNNENEVKIEKEPIKSAILKKDNTNKLLMCFSCKYVSLSYKY